MRNNLGFQNALILDLPEILPDGCRWARTGEIIEASWLLRMANVIVPVAEDVVGLPINDFSIGFIVPDKPRTRLEWMCLGVIEDVYANHSLAAPKE